MKRLIQGLALSLSLLGPLPSKAEIGSIEIHWEKKVVGSKTGRPSAGNVATNTEDCVYTITLANNSFKDAPALVVKYLVFVERQRTGEQKGAEHIDKVMGSKSLDGIKGRQKAIVETDSFTLKQGQLSAGWYYTNGGKTVAKDSIKGVWVRVYQDKNIVAEYVNPSTIRTREKWKE